MLVLAIDTPTAANFVRSGEKLPQTRGMELEFSPTSAGGHELQLALTDESLHEVFNPLATDIAEAVAHGAGERAAVRVFVSRFRGWVRLLESVRDSGLDANDRRGLFGELLVLADLLDLGISPREAITSWTGPNATDQDFQTADGAIEVKTTSGRNSTVSIASERQLDDVGLNWLLLIHIAVDERRGGTGLSLNDLVARLLTRLDATEQPLLWSRLVALGYLPRQQDLYDEPRYTLREKSLFEVTSGFPRIVESDLANGVSDCSYQLDLAALEPWSTDTEALLRHVAVRADDEAQR